MLEARGLSKSFPVPRQRGKAASDSGGSQRRGKLFHAVSEVSFCAETGAILGLLGPNGAGKTTTLRMLSTAIEPTAGTAVMDGVDIVDNPLEVRKRIGFLSGTTGVYGRLTAREMVAYYGRLHGLRGRDLEDRIDDLMVRLEMSAFADVRNDNLSTGMKQKVSIARTLIHDPEVLIFDEPTTGLDVVAAEIVLSLVERYKAAGKTVVFSTHHMHEVEALCSKVVIINEGRLCFEGSVDEMRAQAGEERLDRAFLRHIGRTGAA